MSPPPALQHLPTLAAIAEHGSFSRAADALGLNRAAVSKRIAHLEQVLGVAVLLRTTRKVELTLAGRALLDRHEEAQTLLQMAVDEARGTVTALAGQVRVLCANSSLAVHLVGPALFDFAHRMPGIRIDLMAALASPGTTQPDIELRLTDAPPPDRSARLLARVNWGFFASAGYLRRHGRPTTPQALSGHRFVVPASHDKPATFEHLRSGRQLTLPPSNAMTSNVQEVVFELVKQGKAIGLLPSYLSAPVTGGSALQPLLPQWQLTRLPAQSLYAIHAPARYQRAATRAVLDDLARACAGLDLKP
jgi:DNA-binding transcriptional LysR family regulator